MNKMVEKQDIQSMIGRRFNLFSTIQAKLVAMFLVSVLITIAIVIGFNQAVRRSAIESANQSLLLQAEQLAARIDDFHLRNMQMFSVASTSPLLNDFFAASESERETNTTLRNRVSETLQTFTPQPFDQFNVTSFALLTLEGENIFDTGQALIGRDEADAEYFIPPQRVAAYVSTAIFEPELGGIYFYYSVPVRTFEAPHTLVGVMRVQMPVANIQNLIISDLDSDLHVALIDEYGLRLLDTDAPDLQFKSIRTFDAAERQALLAAKQLPLFSTEQLSVPLPDITEAITTLNGESTIISSSLHANRRLRERIAIIPLETTPFVLLVAQHENEFLTPIQRQTTGMLILTTLLTGSAVLIAVFIARSLNRPLAKLTQVAEKARAGDLTVRAEIYSNDEIGILARAFNQMITQLRQNNATLEERIEQRRIELEAEIEQNTRLQAENVLESERKQILADFIQNVSHEFKTPLSIINMQSYLMRKTTDENDTGLRKRIERISDQSHHIETLVNAMVQMAKLDRETDDANSTKINVASLLNAIETKERAAFDAKGLTFNVFAGDDTTHITGNSNLITDAINCILLNALHYTPPGGNVALRSTVRNGQVLITVIDDGIGIDPEHLPRVFERFYRADNARTTRGFGLGLPITQRIIERFNGTITLNSKPAAGTTVVISLPLTASN